MEDRDRDLTFWLLAWEDLSLGTAESWEGWRRCRVRRRPHPDLIYKAFAPDLARLETSRLKTDVTRIRAWSQDLLLGAGEDSPPPGALELRLEGRVGLRSELGLLAVDLSDLASSELFWALVADHRRGTATIEHGERVLALLSRSQIDRDGESAETFTVATARAALRDLDDALRVSSLPAVAIALAALGWPARWTPAGAREISPPMRPPRGKTLDPGWPTDLAVITLAPELAEGSGISQLGGALSAHGFSFVSATTVYASRPVVDLLYDAPRAPIEERARKFASSFLATSEYAGYVTTILLHRADPAVRAHELLQSLKGSSRPAKSGSASLRGMFPLNVHYFSYLHVIDEHIATPFVEWALPRADTLRPPTSGPAVWEELEKLLAPKPVIDLAPQRLLADTVSTLLLGVALARVSRLDEGLDEIRLELLDAVAAHHPLEPGFVAALEELGGELRALQTYVEPDVPAARRLDLVCRAAAWLCSPRSWTLDELMSLRDAIRFAGAPIDGARLQAVTAWVAFLTEHIDLD